MFCVIDRMEIIFSSKNSFCKGKPVQSNEEKGVTSKNYCDSDWLIKMLISLCIFQTKLFAMSIPKTSGSGNSDRKNDPDAKPLAYERYCRTFNKTPIPEVLDYAKATEESEKKVLNERLDAYERNPTAENRENIWRNFSDFATSVAMDHHYRHQQKRNDAGKAKGESKSKLKWSKKKEFRLWFESIQNRQYFVILCVFVNDSSIWISTLRMKSSWNHSHSEINKFHPIHMMVFYSVNFFQSFKNEQHHQMKSISWFVQYAILYFCFCDFVCLQNSNSNLFAYALWQSVNPVAIQLLFLFNSSFLFVYWISSNSKWLDILAFVAADVCVIWLLSPVSLIQMHQTYKCDTLTLWNAHCSLRKKSKWKKWIDIHCLSFVPWKHTVLVIRSNKNYAYTDFPIQYF